MQPAPEVASNDPSESSTLKNKENTKTIREKEREDETKNENEIVKNRVRPRFLPPPRPSSLRVHILPTPFSGNFIAG